MDWAGAGVGEHILKWLEAAAADRYAREVRLDPFATSMRDFDDVAPNLRALRHGQSPSVSDPRQRITDLKGAGLAAEDNVALTPMGAAVLDSWERQGVASAAKPDELPRILLFILEGHRFKNSGVIGYLKYWAELRQHFNAPDLIDSWDTLYTLNYLDFIRDGFSPGATLRDEGVPLVEIEYDLDDFVREASASEPAVDEADKIGRAIGGKVPRGRHRATFCLALEIILSRGEATDKLLDSFGHPQKPRQWKAFDNDQRKLIKSILVDYDITVDRGDNRERIPEGSAKRSGSRVAPFIPAPTLPEDIDFNEALVSPPKPQEGSRKSTSASVGTGGAPKIDYRKRAERNELVG